MMMIKAKYMKWQADALRKTPLRPHELGESGLAELRRDIVTSVVTLAILSTIALLFIRRITGRLNPDFSAGVGLLIFGALLICFYVTFKFFDKSSEGVVNSGLYWRISVDDTLQDEWEIAQKHKAQSTSFEWLMWGFVGMFGLWVAFSAIEGLTGLTLLGVPSFGVCVVIAITGLYALSLLPLIYTCWTVEPISDEDLAELIAERSVEEAELAAPVEPPKAPLAGKQKWVKRIWDLSPYIVGILIALLWMSKGDGGPFYDIGYNIGQWFGKLVG
ncbi:hypothetical protein N9W89_11635 [Hellea sp.]|nr:hypothetical protein [Hellea sp.]